MPVEMSVVQKVKPTGSTLSLTAQATHPVCFFTQLRCESTFSSDSFIPCLKLNLSSLDSPVRLVEV